MEKLLMDENLQNIVEKEEAELAIKLLEGVPKCRNLANILRKFVNDDSEKIELINQKSYVDVILWSKEDIRNCLVANGFTDTSNNVDEVICNLKSSISDNSIPVGWETIEGVIDGLRLKLERRKG